MIYDIHAYCFEKSKIGSFQPLQNDPLLPGIHNFLQVLPGIFENDKLYRNGQVNQKHSPAYFLLLFCVLYLRGNTLLRLTHTVSFLSSANSARTHPAHCPQE